MIIKTWRDPYDSGFSPTKPKQIEINKGITVLVGCNGAGKTTLLHNIKEELESQEIPCHHYDNLNDGGSSSIGEILSGWNKMPSDDISVGVSLWNASEGEKIKINLNRQSSLYKEFFKTGHFKNSSYRISKLFNNEDNTIKTNDRVLLFDATDSGLSIDAVCEIKEFFNILISDTEKMNINLYIIITANEYELCRNTECFDVNDGKYIRFSDYEDYRSFIINSRKKKEKRIEKQNKWAKKQYEKEFAKFEVLKKENDEKKQKIIEKQNQNISLTWQETDILNDSKLKDYIRRCKFLKWNILETD